jgi:hypothetical protein
MAAERIRYRKLPGHRRGLINGSTVWLAPDHILLVKSMRFKEEYKRFYLRDIQAIAIAKTSRFHISTLGLLVIALWIVLLLFSFRFDAMTLWVWIAALAIAAAWFYVSMERSCTCRIYTAVSSDPLPSVYRTWIARKFLLALEGRIREVQGELDPGWVEAVEERLVGPEAVRDAVRVPPPPPLLEGQPIEPVTPLIAAAPLTGRNMTVASIILLVAILLEVGVGVLMFYGNSLAAGWAFISLLGIQIVASIFVFLDRSKGRLRAPIHRVAIAKLIWLTLLFYSNTIANSVAKITMASATQTLAPGNDLLLGLDTFLSAAFFLAGAFMTFRPVAARQTSILGN